MRFEPEFQPSANATDYHLGIALSRNYKSLSLHSGFIYSLMGKGDATSQFGNALSYNFALSYPFGNFTHKDHKHHAGDSDSNHHHINAAFVLELNGEYRERDEIAGIEKQHTGGNIVYLSPGIRLSSTNNWCWFFSFGLPIVQNTNGIQNDAKHRVISGLSYSF